MLLSLLSVMPAPVEWWPVVLPLVAGAAAIYILLPRPRAYPALWGALLGLIALVLAGVLLTRTGTASVEAVLFYAFSSIALTAGGLLVTQRNPAHAALSFTLVVLSTCGLFLLLAAPFLMAATTVIYAGAIIVTFLFVLMLAQQEGPSDADARSREPMLATITGFLLMGALLFVLQRYDFRLADDSQEIDQLLTRTEQAKQRDTREQISEVVGKPSDSDELFTQYKQMCRSHGWKDLYDQVEKIEMSWPAAQAESDTATMKARLTSLAGIGDDARNRLAFLPPVKDAPLSNLSGPPPTLEAQHLRRDGAGRPQLPAENSAYIGRALFSDFLLPVELGGTLLLVATVGAIAIAYRRP
jgi:NADH-quinone oxidoreductase subunit J